MISKEDLDKIAEIARLHDEAFWHLHQYDGHAKISDGNIKIEIGFGNVWDRNDQKEKSLTPIVGVTIYSYVVATNTPSYQHLGGRHHYFETVNEALQVVKEWHQKAMSYQPTAEELKELDDFADEMWEVIKDKTTIYEIVETTTTKVWPPENFRDKANGE
jgi:hypothetical protein